MVLVLTCLVTVTLPISRRSLSTTARSSSSSIVPTKERLVASRLATLEVGKLLSVTEGVFKFKAC